MNDWITNLRVDRCERVTVITIHPTLKDEPGVLSKY
jgi:hypothetical protein